MLTVGVPTLSFGIDDVLSGAGAGSHSGGDMDAVMQK